MDQARFIKSLQVALVDKKGWMLAYAALVTALLFFYFSRWSYDDPYITYRYAVNLAQGSGFVYNPGLRVLSTTTPGFTLLLALFSPLWPDLPRLANLIGAASLAAGGLFLWQLGQAWETPVVSWTGVALYPVFPLLAATLGSETPLCLALCLGAFFFFARRRYGLAAVFCALAVLVRPDSLLVPGVLAVAYLVENMITTRRGQPAHPFPWQALGLFLALVLPWFLFAWLYFGAPLPTTLAAKQIQGAMAVSQRFIPGFLALAQQYGRSLLYIVEAGLALVGLVCALQRQHRWLAFLSWGGLYFLAYYLLGVSSYFWYYAPLVPGLVAAVGLGLEGLRDETTRLAEHLGQAWGKPAKPDKPYIRRVGQPDAARQAADAWGRNIVLLLLVLLTLGQMLDLAQLYRQPDRRAAAYRVVGEWLRTNTPPGATIGTLEVGIIGYYAQRPMVDFAGLIQPDVAAQLTPASTYQDSARWAVARYRPDFLVLHEGLFSDLENTYVGQHCQLARRFSGLSGYNTALNVYDCRP